MIKDKIYYLIDLCLEVQRGKEGNIESRRSCKELGQFRLADAVEGPTVFFNFYGNTTGLDIQIFNEGWSYGSKLYETFSFYLDKDIDSEQFLKCKTLLENLIEKQKEKEN